MTLYVLDIDHISLYQKSHPQIVARLKLVAPSDLAVTMSQCLFHNFCGRGQAVEGKNKVIQNIPTQNEHGVMFIGSHPNIGKEMRPHL